MTSTRRVLVVHTRTPAYDRDAGSQIIDDAICALVDAGWTVTFLSKEDERTAEQRHVMRLRQLGVEAYTGFAWAERLLRSHQFDLVIIPFWELTAALLPLVRRHRPTARVLVHSVDVHLLRDARRAFATGGPLDERFGAQAVQELNAYDAADAVIAVSEKEQALLGDFLGSERVFHLPLADRTERSTVPLEQRHGTYFVGNYRHLPNQQAVEYLCASVLPLLDPSLLERHPLRVLGNWLDRIDLGVDAGVPHVELIGWVPSLHPYIHQSRVAVLPLLHGAGVKQKVIQAMMGGTPVVTTPIGAEGLDVVHGEHLLVAADTGDLAAGITWLLNDDACWHRLSDAAAQHVRTRHGVDVVRRRFLDIVDAVMARPSSAAGSSAGADPQFRRRIQAVAEAGVTVAVASGGDEAYMDVAPCSGWHFPRARDGGWGGAEPVDGRSAITHLEALHLQGATHFAVPRTAFTWRYRYPELFQHLEAEHRRLHEDEHLLLYELCDEPRSARRPAPTDGVRPSVHVIGRHDALGSGPPPALVRELAAAEHASVTQVWRPVTHPADELTVPDGVGADYVVFVRDDVVVPAGFVDDLVRAHQRLDVDRVQPTHHDGPQAGPPVTERLRGTVAREVDGTTPLPIFSVRAGRPSDGPVVLLDELSVGLRQPLPMDAGSERYSSVRRAWVADAGGSPACWWRTEPSERPRISAIVATHDRPELLRACLQAFAKQTLDRSLFEVVVVDDGSNDCDGVEAAVAEWREAVQLCHLRISHAGRSAAKNHGVLLGRAPLVLFFDDDDRPAPDYLEAHVAAHDRRPEEAVAVLGHTDWAPDLELTPLMHYVTDVDRLLFAYERLRHGQELDWRGFWEGRISCKRSLLTRHGLHDQRLVYSIDVEMAWRLSPRRLRVVYDRSATSVMARPLDLDAFCRRTEAKGRAHAVVAALHRGTEIARRLDVEESAALWRSHGNEEGTLRRRISALEAAVSERGHLPDELHRAYRRLFRLLHGKGAAGDAELPGAGAERPTTVQPFPGTDPELVHDGTPADVSPDPVLSISLPVWSRTPELAAMAQRTVERLWEVSRIPTEVIAVDNGSPFDVPLLAKVYRYPENKGVATGWNTGIRLSKAPVVAVLNSDCVVEPGWDEALYEAATDGRRVAFPYTDHCDGRGFIRPDQGGTAGWCFMMARSVYDEVGVFDEWFNPAFLEDTDYWHRAWELGIELTPVPAARVIHARRTTANTHPRIEMLLQGHRYKYGWKHGVDPHRAPPYYDREIVEYRGTAGCDGTG